MDMIIICAQVAALCFESITNDFSLSRLQTTIYIFTNNTNLSLYNGALAAASATFVGHYPWFFTYNYLSEKIPKQDDQLKELGRRAILGFCSSAVSDTCSNSIRVVKVYKQSHPDQLSYGKVVSNVLQESGVRGLFFRGLETKILANGLQGILFSILWKHFEEALFPKK
jgi:hypothetical protein